MQNKITIALLLTFCMVALSCANKEINIEKSRIHYDIAYDLLRKGEYGPSIEQIQRAISLHPENAEYHNLFGLIYGSAGYIEEAEGEFLAALDLKDDYADVYNNLCGLYISQAQWDRAIDYCKQAVGVITYASPEKAYHNMGWAYYKKGDMMNAIQNYNKALRHRESFYLAHQNLGMVYFDLGKYKLAIQNYEQAINGCNFCPEPYYRLGLALFKVDRRSSALKSFGKCTELDKEGEIGQLCGNFVKKYKK